jgi:hypothetical protein
MSSLYIKLYVYGWLKVKETPALVHKRADSGGTEVASRNRYLLEHGSSDWSLGGCETSGVRAKMRAEGARFAYKTREPS